MFINYALSIVDLETLRRANPSLFLSFHHCSAPGSNSPPPLSGCYRLPQGQGAECSKGSTHHSFTWLTKWKGLHAKVCCLSEWGNGKVPGLFFISKVKLKASDGAPTPACAAYFTLTYRWVHWTRATNHHQVLISLWKTLLNQLLRDNCTAIQNLYVMNCSTSQTFQPPLNKHRGKN